MSHIHQSREPCPKSQLVVYIGTTFSSQSWEYIRIAVPICLRLEAQDDVRAASLAWLKTGKRIAASIAIIAMTTSSSIKVNPLFFNFFTSSHFKIMIKFHY